MRDARPGGNTKPQLISEHGAGQQANKKPRPFHAAALKAPKPQRGAALKEADKQHRVQKIVDSYAQNPRESARKLRELGMGADFIRAIHKSTVADKRTEPAPGAPGFHGLQDALSAVGFGGLAHPIRRFEHPGGRMEFPGFGKVPEGMTIRPAAWDKGGGGIPKGPGPKTNADLIKIAETEPKVPGPKKEMKFPDEMPGHVREAAGRLASQLDKDSVKKLRAEQERLHSEERGKRARVAHAALTKYAGTEKASRIAKSKLAGELPKVPVSKVLGEMSAQDMNVLRHYIHTNERLPFFDKINAEDALNKGLSGHPLTEGERTLLHKTFGKEFATRVEMPSLGTRAMRVAGDLANLPRSLESSFDVSAPFRQGLVAGARHPVISAKNFGPMLKSAVSKKTYEGRLGAIEKRPNYELMRRAKLAFTDVGSAGDREEFYPSHIGDKIPGVKQSGRAYTDYLNNVRADVFDRHIELARKAGYDVNDRHLLESLGRFVNSATGRGDLKTLAGAAKVLNATLFSPRLLKSRLDFLNPAYYAHLHPYARKEALRSALQLLALGTAVLETAAKAGAGVEIDPRSSDFGKMRFGDTRIDIWGGFQPIIRTLAQLGSGERKTTTTGELVPLDGKFGHSSRLDVFENFLRGKLAPVPSVGADLLKGSTFVGQPVTPKSEAAQRLIPFGIQDAYDVHHGGHNALETAGAYGLSAVGVGVQNYANDPTKVARQTHDALTKALEQNVRHYFKRGLTPQIKQALKLREARQVYFAKHVGGNASPLDRFNAQVDLLRKLNKITPAQAKHAREWAAHADEHKVKTEFSRVGRKYFGGEVLSDATKKIREKGGKFYLSDKSTWGAP
jgi:hypothetical protein